MEKPRIYKYVGSPEIGQNIANYSSGTQIGSLTELKTWIEDIYNHPKDLIIATFVIDPTGYLWLADRHSEHVACANGKPVLSAGEIFIGIDRDNICVTDITNQSTGFCPEPESWKYVAVALDRLPIDRPPGFTVEFTFRRCNICSQINIVKDDLFVCEVCNSILAGEWNF